MRLSIIAVVAAVIHPALALANPTWTDRLSATAPGGAHILITHAYDGSEPNNTIASFHGTSHSDWVAGASTSADTGSGTRTLRVRQICDCHVPVNTLLHYQLSPIYAYNFNPGGCDIMGSESGSGGACRDACAAADARDAAAPADGSSPDLADAPTTPSTGDAQGNGGATGTSDVGDAAISTDVATGGATGSGGETTSASIGGATGSGGETTSASSSGGATGSGGETMSASIGGVSGSGGSTSVVTSTGQGGGKSGGGSCSLAPWAHSTAVPVVWVLAGLALAVARRRRP